MTKAQPLVVQSTGLSLGDIYYVLFRHKWKIIACSMLGIIAAAALMRLNPPPYQSEAKLFVRYVLADKAIGPGASDVTAKSPDQRGETIMNSETEILTSIDLARQVAEVVGPEKILAAVGGGKDLGAATAMVRGGLSVVVAPSSSVMHVIYKHPDPEVVQPVLREIVERYLKLHVETHTANGMLSDFLTQETDQLRARLNLTEEELRKALGKAGVVSIEDARRTYTDQTTGIRRELYSAEAELAEKASALEEIRKRLPAGEAANPSSEAEKPIPPEVLDEYRSTASQVDLLHRMEQELLTQFTPQNQRVVEVHTQLTAAEEHRKTLQTKYPRLVQIAPVTTRGPSQEAVDAITLTTQITALKAKIGVYNAQLAGLRSDAVKLDQMEGTITDLRRKKELDEVNYRSYAASLEQARINETLGNGRVSNIVQIQKPSPPFADRSRLNKAVTMILAAGFLSGFAWAFLIELYFDRSIKRAVDVERTIAAPLLLSIPAVTAKRLLARSSATGPAVEGAPAGESSPSALIDYHATLRDRLIGYFESINLNHKPKLVAVTGLTPRSGVSTTAAGLARSLSETGEGNVLLVDMNAGQGASHQFARGREVRGIDELLETRDGAHFDQNLFVVSENSKSDRLSRNMPQRFTKLVPKLKASDFDYIIFDMPPVSQISITPRLAGFMDMVLLVLESEKTDREAAQRATRLLAESRSHVGVVLNKTRQYVPARLHQEPLAV